METNKIGRNQNTSQSTQHRRIDECDHDHGGDGNAEQRGHFLILRSRLQFLADQRVLEEPVLKHHHRNRDDDNE